MRKGWIANKLQDDQSKPNKAAQTVAQCLHGTLENNYFVPKCVAFSGDNCNKLLGGVTRASTKMFCKLKDSINEELISVGCLTHILNNYLQHGMDSLHLHIQLVISFIFIRFINSF
jgi:hypothetical protein